jgi:LacI family transcriptional regulator
LKVTLKTIADDVGVSITTVSRVLNNQSKKYRIVSRVLNNQSKKYRIGSQTEANILRKAKELGYVPNQLARSLRMRRSNIIGLIIPDISNPFFAQLSRVIENQARKKGYSIILSDTQEYKQLEVDSIRILQSRKVDGIIICPNGEESTHLKKIIESNLPIVIVDRYIKGLKCPHVISDNYRGSYEAISHFIEKNHKNIACIQGNPMTSVNDERVRGYKDAMSKNNLPFDEKNIIGDSFGERNGYVSAKLLLSKNPRPSAFFACSNLISLGAMRAILEEGLKIPEDISMISFDDQPYSEYLATPMTVVVQQTREMGQIAFNLLLAQLSHSSPASSEGVVLPTKLVLRCSVADHKMSQKFKENDETLNSQFSVSEIN